MTSVEPERMPVAGSLRLLRAAMFAAGAVWLSSTAHVLGGGAAPSAALLALLMLFVAAPASLLAGRRRGPVAITVGLLALQAGLHYVLGATASPVSCSVMPAMSGPQMHMVHSMPVSGGPGACPAIGLGPAMTGTTASMLIWHAGAAVVLALLLSLGERVLWQVVTWFVPRLNPTASGPVVPAVGTGRVIGSRPSRRLVIRLLVGGLGRRGPPRTSGAPA